MGVFRKPFIRPYKTHRWIGSLSAGGSLVIRTTADALNLSDNATRIVTFLRDASDALGLADTVSRVGSFLRDTSDSLSLADSASALKVNIREVADALNLSDAATRVVTLLRDTTDSLALSDAVSRIVTLLRASSDSVTFSDSAEASTTIQRSTTDALSLIDTVTRAGTFLRTISDALSLGDTVTRITTAIRTAGDSLAFSESVTGIITGIYRTTTDSLGLSDVADRVIFLAEAQVVIDSRTSRRRVTGINIETVRRHAPMSDFAKTRTKLDQRRFDDTAWGLEGFGDSLGDLSGNNGPIPDMGDMEVVIPATCDSPELIIILDDPNDPAPTTDSYPANQTIYEELERVGDEFDPTFSVQFYRAVWFDGLEAYDPTHYDVGPTGNVIPNTVLIPGTVVTAQYVKAD